MRVFRGLSRPLVAPTALTIGNFDGVHLGHRALLARLIDIAHQQNGQATVLTFEPHPREFFSPASAPARLATLREKLELLAECGVDQVVVSPFNAVLAAISAEAFVRQILLQQLNCRHLIVGDDFRFGAKRAGDFSLLKRLFAEAGAQVESLDSVQVSGQRVASSAVREALLGGHMDLAARFLGRFYRMDGRVVAGKRLGRALGFPTANIFIRHSPLPLTGVFVVQVDGLLGGAVNGVANLGVRPTVDGDKVVMRPILEVHLLDFSNDIYGQHLQVSFLHKLRSEQKFPDLNALKAQIACDAQAARAYFRNGAVE